MLHSSQANQQASQMPVPPVTPDCVASESCLFIPSVHSRCRPSSFGAVTSARPRLVKSSCDRQGGQHLFPNPSPAKKIPNHSRHVREAKTFVTGRRFFIFQLPAAKWPDVGFRLTVFHGAEDMQSSQVESSGLQKLLSIPIEIDVVSKGRKPTRFQFR